MSGSLTELMEQSAAEAVATITQAEDGFQVSLPQLLESARRAAGDLRARGVGRGDRVGLILENGTGFLRVLFAVMYAGGVAVPLALPSAMGPETFARHLRRVAADADMRHVVINPRVRRLLRRYQDPDEPLSCLFIEEGELSGQGQALVDPAGLESLALIQYTSGSTSSPKGVMLTGRNIAAGLEAITGGSAVGTTDILGSWLPLFHDMGIFSVLVALVTGVNVVLWRPMSFIRRPAAWLAEFAARGCTVCSAPNFFYDYLAEADDDLPPDLDLSAWRIAYNGAEPVLASTIERFCGRFAGYGFRRETMFPVYGLAEAVLGVTFPPPGTRPDVLWADRSQLVSAGRVTAARPGAPGALPLVSVGRAIPGVRLRMAGAGGAEDLVGEIEITGASVTRGYYGRDNDGYFTADGWLRTGDLGFLHSGLLYIAGRSKDLITIRGTNYFAEDAESIVRDLPGIYRKSCAAVGTMTAAGECLTIVAETNMLKGGVRETLTSVIRSEIRDNLGLLDAAVHLVPPQSLPRTSSGKIQRAIVRARLSSGQPISV